MFPRPAWYTEVAIAFEAIFKAMNVCGNETFYTTIRIKQNGINHYSQLHKFFLIFFDNFLISAIDADKK